MFIFSSIVKFGFDMAVHKKLMHFMDKVFRFQCVMYLCEVLDKVQKGMKYEALTELINKTLISPQGFILNVSNFQRWLNDFLIGLLIFASFSPDAGFIFFRRSV